MDFLMEVNAFMWVTANLLLAYSGVMLVLFLLGYLILFNPRLTTAGSFIFRFIVSLVGVVALSFIGVFIDPAPDTAWFEFPGQQIEPWRPVLRLLIYAFVAFTTTSLTVFVIVRKWFPHKLRTPKDKELFEERKLR